MRYGIWLSPHMPTPEQRVPNYYYCPKSYIKDERLNYLDKEVYLNLVGIEQDNPVKPYDIKTLIKAIRTNPDEDEKILDNYLQQTGKNADDLTKKEWKQLSTVPVTDADIEESLKRLEKYGYIKKMED